MLGVVTDEGDEYVKAGVSRGEFRETDLPRYGDAFGGSEYSRSF